jgi:hypothetical protein
MTWTSTFFFNSAGIDGWKYFPTDRIHPLIVDENLQTQKKYTFLNTK